MERHVGLMAYQYGLKPDPAFSDAPLDEADTETVGKMTHRDQGIGGHIHNSADLPFIGPIDRDMPERHNSADIQPTFGPA